MAASTASWTMLFGFVAIVLPPAPSWSRRYVPAYTTFLLKKRHPCPYPSRSKLLRQRTRRWHPDEMVVPIAQQADVSVACRRSRRRDPRHFGALPQPDCGPGSNQQGANQGASAGGLGEGGNEDESQEFREEDPGGRTRYGNHAGPGG